MPPAPAGRDEAYEKWRRADPRHHGVIAWQAWQAAWGVCVEHESHRVARLALKFLRAREARQVLRGRVVAVTRRLERAQAIGERVDVPELIRELKTITGDTT